MASWFVYLNVIIMINLYYYMWFYLTFLWVWFGCSRRGGEEGRRRPPKTSRCTFRFPCCSLTDYVPGQLAQKILISLVAPIKIKVILSGFQSVLSNGDGEEANVNKPGFFTLENVGMMHYTTLLTCLWLWTQIFLFICRVRIFLGHLLGFSTKLLFAVVYSVATVSPPSALANRSSPVDVIVAANYIFKNSIYFNLQCVTSVSLLWQGE